MTRGAGLLTLYHGGWMNNHAVNAAPEVSTDWLWGKVGRAVERQDFAKTTAALRRVLRQIVPEARDATEPRYHHPNPAGSLRWTIATGHLTLRVEVVRWHSYIVTSWAGTPGITARPRLLFRDGTNDLFTVQSLVASALRHAR